jgi:protein-disulfide isomerase
MRLFSMKRYLPFFIVGTVALVTLASGTLLYRAKRLPALAIPENSTTSAMGGTEMVHVRGRADAPVTLVEFGDFQCPPCANLSDPINQLERDYHSRLRVAFRHFPLGNHPHAREAALASEAAGLQGRFWEMHDLLYREQSAWSGAPDVRVLFNAYAGMLGLNIDRFKKDMESEQAKARIESDEQKGVALGVRTTPTIFINNHAVPAARLNPPGLRGSIDAALRAPTPASSTQ